MSQQLRVDTPRHSLVTGATGFMGRYLVRALIQRGDFVRVICNKHSKGQVMPNVEAFFCDLSTSSPPQEAFSGVDTVYHLAGIGSPSSPYQDNERIVQLNVLGTQRVLQAARDAGVSRVVFASSASVYGSGSGEPLAESLPTAPTSTYAASKIAAEDLCLLHRQSYGLDTRIVRIFNVYGPEQRENMVIPRFIGQLLRNEPITLVGGGMQERDFIYVTDAVAALLAAGEELDSSHRVFNAGTGEPVTIRFVAEQLGAATGVEPQIHIIGSGMKGTNSSSACPELAQKVLNWAPSVSITDGLLRTVRSTELVAARAG